MQNSTVFSPSLKISKTRSAFLWTHVLRAPFWAIYNLLLFILYKDLHATPFQIALFIALKPVVSILSIYWGGYIHQRPDRLLPNIIWGGILSYIPFLFFPAFYNAWFVLFASAWFMVLYRGVVPAWMEIFKKNLPGEMKQRVFSYGAMVSFIVGSCLPLFMGPLLDHYPLIWRWIFLITGAIGIIAIVFQRNIPIEPSETSGSLPSFKEHLISPWKKTWEIISSNQGFRSFQIGFMVLGGGGLMIFQPALPSFFVDVLGLSYTELAIALTLCKGVGFALTSPLWAKAMPRFDIFPFGGAVTLGGFLFPLILLLGGFHHFWIYAAYFLYGIMQAGSELAWHLSGPHFSGEKDSSTFSNVNILTVGLRGLVIPQLGALLCFFFPSAAVLFIGGGLCLSGMLFLWLKGKKNPHSLRREQGIEF